MGLRTILIITGLALASTFGVAQRVSSTPTTGGAAAGNGTNVGTGTNVNSPAATTSVPPPGVTSVPIGINAIGSGSGTAQITNVPTAVIVPTTGFNGPSQTFPLVTTPTVTFVNSADGTSTVPVLNYGGGASPVAGNAGAAANNGNNSTANQTADLNLGNVSS